MTPNESPSSTLQRLFSGIAEQTFQVQLGVVDPEMIDYLSNLLIRFVRTESVHRVRNPQGKVVGEIGNMLVEADQRVGTARRDIHRHIGDFALFWAGLYPESLRRSRAHLDQFVDYCQHGKRAYLIASTIDTDRCEDVSSHVLERLGHQFEMCAYGLREVRREWESN